MTAPVHFLHVDQHIVRGVIDGRFRHLITTCRSLAEFMLITGHKTCRCAASIRSPGLSIFSAPQSHAKLQFECPTVAKSKGERRPMISTKSLICVRADPKTNPIYRSTSNWILAIDLRPRSLRMPANQSRKSLRTCSFTKSFVYAISSLSSGRYLVSNTYPIMTRVISHLKYSEKIRPAFYWNFFWKNYNYKSDLLF